MDSTASLVALHFAAQGAPSMTEPLSAELLHYRLSRTPTPRRFNRNRTVATPLAPETGSLHGQNTPSLPRTKFRPASELLVVPATKDEAPSSSIRVVRRRPAPKLYSTLSQTTTDSTFTTQSRGQPSNSSRHTDSFSGTTASEHQERPSDQSLTSSDDTDDLTLNDAIREAAVLRQVNDTRKVLEQDSPPPENAQRQIATSQTHVSETQPSSDAAEKRKLKRPAKRTPLPSAPPSIQQLTATEGGTSSRQYSIPDDERPATAKKRARARQLPVDELELAEERQIPYDAPPMSDSDEADSDPVEESTQRSARPQRKAKRTTDTSVARETKKKPIAVKNKAQSQRENFFAGFKVIKCPVPSNTSKKSTSEHPIIGDGFEGLERLPTGRPVRSANKRRQTKPRLAPPTKYYRSLEIVEDKSFEQALHQSYDLSSIKVEQIVSERPNNHQGSEHPAVPAYDPQGHAINESRNLPMAPEHPVTVTADMARPAATEEACNETEGIDNLEAPVVQGTVMQNKSLPDAGPTSCIEPIEERTSLLQDAETPGECLVSTAIEPHEPVWEPIIVPEGGETSEGLPDAKTVEPRQQTEEPAAAQGRALSPAEEEEDGLAHDVVQSQPEKPQVESQVVHETKQGYPKVKRTVTFSEEVKVVADVEAESEEEEEEMNSSDEQHSSESGSESGDGSDQSQKSDADESEDEGDEAGGSQGDGEDNEDEDDDDYPRGNLRPRNSSPELVSSGHYDRSDNLRQPCSDVNQAEKEPHSFDDEDGIAPGEDNMMLDMDEEIEDMPEPPQSYAYETGKMAYFIDSDEEMLSVTSRATSPIREFPPRDDKIELVELPPLAERGQRTDRGGKARTLRDASIPDSEPDHLFEGDYPQPTAGVYDMCDDELPSTRDENFEDLSQRSHYEKDRVHSGPSSFGGATQQPNLKPAASFSPRSTGGRDRGDKPRWLNAAVYQDSRKLVIESAATPPTNVVRQEQHYGIPRTSPAFGPRKIKRAKTGLSHIRASQQSSPATQNTAVMDVPSYFQQASQRLSSPLKDAVVMMRRAKTLPSTQYVSGDEEGFIVMSDESFRNRLSGRKRHLSLSDSVESENITLRDLVKRSNDEMGRSMEVKRKRSLPFKSPSQVR